MSISDLPLSYCTNVHPGRTLDEVIANLDKYAVPVAERYGRPMGVGLWFAREASRVVPYGFHKLIELKSQMQAHRLCGYTMNAFPAGDFHQRRVKDTVYQPSWGYADRLFYTFDCAQILRKLLDDGDEGSISTLPLGFKAHAQHDDFIAACFNHVVAAALGLNRIAVQTGHRIRLAIEPEPLCLLETTDEAIALFERLWEQADAQGNETGQIVRDHIGLCYDICHQAVEFEDAAESIAKIDAAGIRINKVQISNAIEVANPGSNEAARAALRDYVDERYLHQTFGLMPDGSVMRVTDLTHEFLDDPGPMLDATKWRIHYHVPVNQRHIGPLGTTHGEVRKALEAIAKLDYAPHLEVETYTWSVMPGESVDLVAGLAAEMTATAKLLDEIRAQG